MAKRRTLNPSSKRFSKNKSNDFIGTRLLDPDTSIIAEEQTHWWNNLDETMSSPRSLIHNNVNETSQELNLNSQSESNRNTSQWWKHLESSFDSGNNTSTRSRPNLSAAIAKTNIVETSTSESEKERNLKKRKVQLRVKSRKSNNNAFLDALNDTEVTTPLKLRMKQANSNLHNKSDREGSERKLDENKEHNSNLSSSSSLSPSILKLKPSIFKKRRNSRTRDQNPYSFQDIITDSDSLDARRKSVTFEKESSKYSVHQNINTSKDHTDDQRKTIQSQTSPLKNNEAGSLNLSPSKVMHENNVASDINKIVETSDESDIKINNRKRFKFKSHLIHRARRSMEKNPFESVLVENRDINKHNEDEIDIHDAKSPLKTKSLSTPTKQIVKTSMKKTDVTHENVLANSPIRRSPRSLKTTNKNLLDTSTQTSNIEQDTSNSSLDTNKFHKKSAFLKLKSNILSSYKKSLSNNPFEGILMEDDNARKNNIVAPTENSQRNIIIADKSSNKKQIADKSPNKKQISLSNKSTRDMSEISKEHTNAISPADKTNINEMEADEVTNDSKSFTVKNASSTSNTRILLTSQAVNVESFEKIKAEIDRLKIREMTAMRTPSVKKDSALNGKNVKLFGAIRKPSTKKSNPSKAVHEAYLVHGKIYKPPRLPRPKSWVTDRLYKFLWKRLEPKYQLSTRVRSEKFVVSLAKIVSIIERRKKYDNYKVELEALMKEMARLNIIKTRDDFHHFCWDFMPSEFRIKVIPMLLPGNKRNIPFEPENLHTPLLEET